MLSKLWILVADWSMHWSRDTFLINLRLYLIPLPLHCHTENKIVLSERISTHCIRLRRLLKNLNAFISQISILSFCALDDGDQIAWISVQRALNTVVGLLLIHTVISVSSSPATLNYLGDPCPVSIFWFFFTFVSSDLWARNSNYLNWKEIDIGTRVKHRHLCINNGTQITWLSLLIGTIIFLNLLLNVMVDMYKIIISPRHHNSSLILCLIQ